MANPAPAVADQCRAKGGVGDAAADIQPGATGGGFAGGDGVAGEDQVVQPAGAAEAGAERAAKGVAGVGKQAAGVVANGRPWRSLPLCYLTA